MEKIRRYEDLDVYRMAYQAALDMHRLTLKFPSVEQFELARQIRKSSKSICANLAEGFGKQSQSKPEFKRFLSMAIGSADETKVWLDFAKDLGYLTKENHERFKETYTIIAKMLSGLHRNWG